MPNITDLFVKPSEYSLRSVEFTAKEKKAKKKKRMRNDKPVTTPLCTKCGENGNITNFYLTRNEEFFYNTMRCPYCKKCIIEMYNEYLVFHGDQEMALYYTCRKIDMWFSHKLFLRVVPRSLERANTLITQYMSTYLTDSRNSPNSVGVCFDESESFLDLERYKESIAQVDNVLINPKEDKLESRSETDCIRLLGFDPFPENTMKERTFLFENLLRFLDEATLEDPFRRLNVIEIVKNTGQMNKINELIANKTNSLEETEDGASLIAKLIDAKDKLALSNLKIAKDNGISLSYNLQKSKGAGTVSGIVRELDEVGLVDAKYNLYDVRTSKAIRQIADISNASIMEQLNLQESEYCDMVKELRQVRISLEKNLASAEEEARLAKVKVSDLEKVNSKMAKYIEKLEQKIQNFR